MGKPAFPALVFGVPFEAYSRIDAEHFSQLKAIDVSPRHYLAAKGGETSTALAIGRAVHELVCDPCAAGIAVYEGRRAGADWEAFKVENRGKTILSAKEHAYVLDLRAAIEHNPRAAALFRAGRGESVAIWFDDGIKCKARIDWILPDGGLVELKTAARVIPRAFAAHVASYNYHAQMALYSHGLTLAQGFRPPSHTIVAIEKKAPYDVVVYRVGQEVLEVGSRKIVQWLDTLKRCRELGQWPGISGQDEIDLVLPDYTLTDGLPDVEMENDDAEE